MQRRCPETTLAGHTCRRDCIRSDGVCVSHIVPAIVGRKTLLTPDVADQIVELLRAGNRLTTALGVVGISSSVFYRWHVRGRTDGTDAIDAPYRHLRARVEQARAEAQARVTAQIAAAAATDWRAAACYLEREFPERWAVRG